MFDVYIALGDSMSIDSYPEFDAESAGIHSKQDLGAAALLYRNENQVFPEFSGKDLSTMFPGIAYLNLAIDGGVTEDLLSPVRTAELAQFENANALVTLTVGGNDLLSTYRRMVVFDGNAATDELLDVCNRYQRIVRMLKERLPKAKLIATTVYDPTDGAGLLPTVGEKKLPMEFLDSYNAWVKKCATAEGILFADVHKHFLGHGATARANGDYWYLRTNPIEPGYKGASEIRRLWSEALASTGCQESEVNVF